MLTHQYVNTGLRSGNLFVVALQNLRPVLFVKTWVCALPFQGRGQMPCIISCILDLGGLSWGLYKEHCVVYFVGKRLCTNLFTHLEERL